MLFPFEISGLRQPVSCTAFPSFGGLTARLERAGDYRLCLECGKLTGRIEEHFAKDHLGRPLLSRGQGLS